MFNVCFKKVFFVLESKESKGEKTTEVKEKIRKVESEKGALGFLKLRVIFFKENWLNVMKKVLRSMLLITFRR